MAKPVIVCVVGTRPDAIKSGPVVLELRKFPEVDTLLVATGQHREMLAQALGAFGLAPDIDLEIMEHGQSLAKVTSRALEGLDRLIGENSPAIVLAQGDTTTTLCAGMAAFYRKVPFGHIEAGLRTATIHDPFPEEFNRRTLSLIAALNFAPTRWAAENLRREGVTDSSICITGNTGIDAVKMMAAMRTQTWFPQHTGRIVLLTTHRRENWGDKQMQIAQAALELVRQVPDVLLVIPMHRNEVVRLTLGSVLKGQPRVEMIEPPDYPDFVKLMERSTVILTDSGGVQEEAPVLGVPVVVLRDTTERPEGIEAGSAVLAGTEASAIVEAALRWLTDPAELARASLATSPYGDGRAAQRIRYLTLKHLGIQSPTEAMWT